MPLVETDLEERRRAVDARGVDEDVDRDRGRLRRPSGGLDRVRVASRRPSAAIARAPAASSAATRAPARSSERPRTATAAPASASPWQMAPPRTPVPPMTAATRPAQVEHPRAGHRPSAAPSLTAVAGVGAIAARVRRDHRALACGLAVGCPRVYCRTISHARTHFEGQRVTQYVFDPRDADPVSVPDPHERPDHGSRARASVRSVLRDPGAGRGAAAPRPRRCRAGLLHPRGRGDDDRRSATQPRRCRCGSGDFVRTPPGVPTTRSAATGDGAVRLPQHRLLHGRAAGSPSPPGTATSERCAG